MSWGFVRPLTRRLQLHDAIIAAIGRNCNCDCSCHATAVSPWIVRATVALIIQTEANHIEQQNDVTLAMRKLIEIVIGCTSVLQCERTVVLQSAEMRNFSAVECGKAIGVICGTFCNGFSANHPLTTVLSAFRILQNINGCSLRCKHDRKGDGTAPAAIRPARRPPIGLVTDRAVPSSFSMHAS